MSNRLYSKTWSTLGHLLDPITQDACAFYQALALFDDFTGVVLETSGGERIARTLGDRKAVILRNHGLLTVGHSVDEAVWRFIRLDEVAHSQLLAEAVGKPVVIEHEIALKVQKLVGSHQAGWRGFQYLWDDIVREQPDFLN